MPELEYTESLPAPALRDVVRCVWTLRGRAGGDDAPEPIVPDGCAELLFNLADPFEQVRADGGAPVRQPLVMLVGPSTAPVTVRPTGAVDLVGVRLQPWAVACVLGLPGAELRDRVEALAEVTSAPALAELAERLAGADGEGDARHAHVSAALLGAVRRRPAPAARALVQAARTAGPDGEGPTVRALAARAGLGVRAAERLFATEVGLPPRALLRIARVQRALALARSSPALPWAAIAARAGYHDQPHLVREFRALVGCTPTALRADVDGLTETFRDKSR